MAGDWERPTMVGSIACCITSVIDDNNSDGIIIFVVVDVVIDRALSTRVLGTGVTVDASDAVGGYIRSEEESWTSDIVGVGSACGSMLGVSSAMSNNDAGIVMPLESSHGIEKWHFGKQHRK